MGITEVDRDERIGRGKEDIGFERSWCGVEDVEFRAIDHLKNDDIVRKSCSEGDSISGNV